MPNRTEPRVSTNLTLRIFGMCDERPFLQNVRAHNISVRGALLIGLEHKVNAGDLIGVQYGNKKARCRVVWLIDAGPLKKLQVGVQLLEDQECPWNEELSKAETITLPSGANKRRFVRRKIRFPLELREKHRNAALHTNATDISGRGCYIETLMPFSFGTAVNISFWMDSERVDTHGVVRASDPGVGMGIEFTGLDYQAQERFQRMLETLDEACAPKSDSTSAAE
jgi:hypothetical protein